MALRSAQEDALRNPRPGIKPDDFVIIRCVDAGGQIGLEAGADYLVLRRFVRFE